MAEPSLATEALPESEIRSRVMELGEALAHDYEGRDPLFVVILNGSVPFGADLVRAVSINAEVDFLGLNRFGESGRIGITLDTTAPLFDRNVVIVEDIIDTGLTLNYLLKYLADKGPASVRIVCLLDKPARRLVEIPIDYRGFEIPDRFVIGYGLDYDERYRNLPYIGVLKPSVYGGAPPEG
jgi:hypoxanthine phosphoribosyltransferase